MKKIDFSYYLRWLKIFFANIASKFSKWEKTAIFTLIIVCITSGSLLLYSNWISHTKEEPNYGGAYREGIILENTEDLTDTINRLTKIGLTRFSDDGSIASDVAESWEISDDVNEYTFVIKDQFPRDDVLKELEKQKDKWPGIEITAKDENKIVFKFAQPFSPFLATTTAPVLPYGPYKLVNKDSKQVKLEVNKDFHLGRPYLDEIILKIYPDKENLIKAYKEKQIDGVYYVDDKANFPNTNFYTFDLPRYNMMFLNTDREIFKDKTTRQKIANNEKLDSETKAVVVALDSEENRALLEDLLKKWNDINFKADIYYKSANELLNNVIPNRDYDVLIYGLDYGYDPDPYPFWHSTQSGSAGFNLSNFSDIDADVLLEDARKIADTKVRKEKYDEFWSIFNEEVPAVIISQDEWVFGISDKFKGVKKGYAISPEDRFLYIYKWYTNTKRVSREK